MGSHGQGIGQVGKRKYVGVHPESFPGMPWYAQFNNKFNFTGKTRVGLPLGDFSILLPQLELQGNFFMPTPYPHSITAHIPQLRHQHLNLVCNHPWYKILQKHLETFKNFYNILFHFSQIILPNYCITLSVSHKVQNFALRKLSNVHSHSSKIQ